jgi:glycosyltransferase involved in cell wall biosynthesis
MPLRELRVSLVVPVKNEAGSLPELLESIRAQTRRPDEVVIVDGGSTDGTIACARKASTADCPIRLIEAGSATPGKGRNIGTAAAQYEWIAYTDAGIRLDSEWIEQLAAAVERHPAAAVVYGTYEPVIGTFFDRCAALAYVPPEIERGDGRARGPFIASSLVRRDAWQAVGGFPDLRAAEDLMFMEALERAGYEIVWAPRARVWWRMQPSLGGTIRRFALYSKHNVLAGRQRYWHYGVLRQYAALAACLALAVVLSPWFLLLAVGGALVRIGRGIWRRRGRHGLLWCLNPFQFAMVALVVFATDAATLAGWVQALMSQPAPVFDGSPKKGSDAIT